MRPLEPDDPRDVGRYVLLARVSTGGMAVVYLGRSPAGRPVAVKRMHPEFASDVRLRYRFAREVRIGRVVGGRYSPAVLDADSDAAVPWLASEFVPSVTLRDAVRAAGPMPAGAAWRLAAGLAEALAFLHGAGVAHLDITPRNVLLGVDGVRLVDFGLARMFGDADPVEPAGSPGFMAPEQATGATTVGAPSDVYGLGATLVYACSGEPPLGGTPASGGDPVLRELLASALRPDQRARPGAAAVLDAAVAGYASAGDTALPAAVTAAIDRSGAEATNPPSPAGGSTALFDRPGPVSGRTRRSVLGVVVGGVAAAAASAGAWTVFRSDDPAGGGGPSQADGTSPTPAGRALEFRCEGDAPLIALTYTVNGATVALQNVPLPWLQTVPVPPSPERTSWRLTFRHPPGDFGYRVSVNGATVHSGSSGSTSEPKDDEAEGSV